MSWDLEEGPTGVGTYRGLLIDGFDSKPLVAEGNAVNFVPWKTQFWSQPENGRMIRK